MYQKASEREEGKPRILIIIDRRVDDAAHLSPPSTNTSTLSARSSIQNFFSLAKHTKSNNYDEMNARSLALVHVVKNNQKIFIRDMTLMFPFLA